MGTRPERQATLRQTHRWGRAAQKRKPLPYPLQEYDAENPRPSWPVNRGIENGKNSTRSSPELPSLRARQKNQAHAGLHPALVWKMRDRRVDRPHQKNGVAIMITRTLKKIPDVFPISNIRVIDGDTIEADIIQAFGSITRKRIRLRGWWAPELGGDHRVDGLRAKMLLEIYCNDIAFWIQAPSARLDRYGRVIAHLMIGNEIVNPHEILGELQLTEAEHKRRADHLLRSRGSTPEARSAEAAHRGSTITDERLEAAYRAYVTQLPEADAENPGPPAGGA